MDDEVRPQDGTQDRSELALDLNFVPTWARQPPENPYAGREDAGARERGRERRDDRRGPFGRRDGGDRRAPRPGGGPRPEGGFRPGGDRRPEGRFRPAGGGPPGGGFRPREGARPEGGFSRPPREGDRHGPRRDGERRPPRETLPRLDVRVAFLPDRERLALVVRDIQVSRRAFPLIEIASRFLGREDLYLVKLELPAAP
jgi:hypothetical protein